jgi:hypothetical protein
VKGRIYFSFALRLFHHFWGKTGLFHEMKISRESGACPEIGAKSKIISCFISVYGQFCADGAYASHMK